MNFYLNFSIQQIRYFSKKQFKTSKEAKADISIDSSKLSNEYILQKQKENAERGMYKVVKYQAFNKKIDKKINRVIAKETIKTHKANTLIKNKKQLEEIPVIKKKQSKFINELKLKYYLFKLKNKKKQNRLLKKFRENNPINFKKNITLYDYHLFFILKKIKWSHFYDEKHLSKSNKDKYFNFKANFIKKRTNKFFKKFLLKNISINIKTLKKVNKKNNNYLFIRKYIALLNYNAKLKTVFYKKVLNKFFVKNGLKEKGENFFFNFIKTCSNTFLHHDFYKNFLIFKFYLLTFFFKYSDLKLSLKNLNLSFLKIFYYKPFIFYNTIFFKNDYKYINSKFFINYKIILNLWFFDFYFYLKQIFYKLNYFFTLNLFNIEIYNLIESYKILKYKSLKLNANTNIKKKYTFIR